MGLVHHEKPRGGGELRQHLVPEIGIVEPLGGYRTGRAFKFQVVLEP